MGAGESSLFNVLDSTFSASGLLYYTDFAEGLIRNVTFDGGNSGAFEVRNCGELEISELSVTNTYVTGSPGGALYVVGNASDTTNSTWTVVSVTDSNFVSCTSDQEGGAASFNYANAYILDSTFTLCTGKNGGAISLSNSVNSSVVGSNFTGNSADYGGAIELNDYIYGFSLEDLVFINNTVNGDGSCLDCCNGVPNSLSCFIQVYVVPESFTGSGNVGGTTNNTCPYTDIESVSVSPVSVSTITPANDDDGIPWWAWLIIALVLIAILVAVLGGVGFFLWQKNRKTAHYDAVE
jgi:hypothetical protein